MNCLFIPAFSLEKEGRLILYQSRPVVHLSAHTYPKFLVNESSPKLLDVATSNFAGA